MDQYQHQEQYSHNHHQPSAFPQQFPEASFQQEQSSMDSEDRSSAFLPPPHFTVRAYVLQGDKDPDRELAIHRWRYNSHQYL